MNHSLSLTVFAVWLVINQFGLRNPVAHTGGHGDGNPAIRSAWPRHRRVHDRLVAGPALEHAAGGAGAQLQRWQLPATLQFFGVLCLVAAAIALSTLLLLRRRRAPASAH